MVLKKTKEKTMKKLLVVSILLGVITSHSFAAAAFCSPYITQAFTKVFETVKMAMAMTNAQMENDVIPKAKETLAKTKEENEKLRQLIAIQQNIALQQEELIFNLEKKIRMRN